jgi:soluble lytic murein transglycosylase
MKNIIIQFTSIIIILATLAACGGPASEPAPGQSESQQATLTPAPLPTPTLIPTPRPQVRLEQAYQLMLHGDYDGARQEFDLALNQAADSETQAASLLGIGRLQLLQKQYTLATQSFLTVIQNYPDSQQIAKTQFFLGQSYAAMNNHSVAADAFGQYLALRPGVIDAYVQELRGNSLLAAGQYTDAIAAYEAAAAAPRRSDPTPLKFKIAQAYSNLGEYEKSISRYWEIYQSTTNDFTKAQSNFLLGQAYLAIGLPEQAYARFQESVSNYPLAYDSYSGLVVLINNGQVVSDLDRGLVDYFAGQYGLAIDAFSRYMLTNPQHDATPLYYRALSNRSLGQYGAELQDWERIISQYETDRFWIDAWKEKAYTQWVYFGNYSAAAATLSQFVARFPAAAQAPALLLEAGRIYERGNLLKEAIETWQGVANNYPTSEEALTCLYLSGLNLYRTKDYLASLADFQRYLAIASTPRDISAAYLWIGKAKTALGDREGARQSWEQAAQRDPTGYYSERARDLLQGREPFSSPVFYNLDYNLTQERAIAETWMRSTFSLPPETDLNSLSDLEQNARFQRANEYWELGLFELANNELQDLKDEISNDPTNCFRLLKYLMDHGFYRQAIFLSRHILDLAGMDNAATFTAPPYFNHIRFGVYYPDYVLSAAQEYNFHPLFLLSVIRQESLFDGLVQSTAGARGLMQIIPSTGQEVANLLNWPTGYTVSDLDRPLVNIRLGTAYLARQRTYFNADPYMALAAYNAGPGNAQQWAALVENDPDLYMELIRFKETRTYITQIYEFYGIYRRLFETEPSS